MSEVTVEICFLESERPNQVAPQSAHPGDAGVDLTAATDALVCSGGGRAVVRTGISVAIPAGYAGFVLPRSGLASRHGVTVVNSPGLVDSGYRGELVVPLINTDPTIDYNVHRGDRIAQLVVMPVPAISWVRTEHLSPFLEPVSLGNSPLRGEGGLGSSGR